MVEHTPGPWEAEHGADSFFLVTHDDGLESRNVKQDAKLIAAAPDHADIGWAMCVGSGRWEPWGDMRGEFVMNGIRHATKLDAFGVPEVTPAMRAAIAKARAQTPSGDL